MFKIFLKNLSIIGMTMTSVIAMEADKSSTNGFLRNPCFEEQSELLAKHSAFNPVVSIKIPYSIKNDGFMCQFQAGMVVHPNGILTIFNTLDNDLFNKVEEISSTIMKATFKNKLYISIHPESSFDKAHKYKNCEVYFVKNSYSQLREKKVCNEDGSLTTKTKGCVDNYAFIHSPKSFPNVINFDTLRNMMGDIPGFLTCSFTPTIDDVKKYKKLYAFLSLKVDLDLMGREYPVTFMHQCTLTSENYWHPQMFQYNACPGSPIFIRIADGTIKLLGLGVGRASCSIELDGVLRNNIDCNVTVAIQKVDRSTNSFNGFVPAFEDLYTVFLSKMKEKYGYTLRVLESM